MADHTPGPWTINDVGFGVDILTQDKHEIVHVFHTHGDVAKQSANARLIAAAPDLLTACEAALEGFRLTREYVGEATLPAIEGWSWFDATVALKAAIANAKGGPDG